MALASSLFWRGETLEKSSLTITWQVLNWTSTIEPSNFVRLGHLEVCLFLDFDFAESVSASFPNFDGTSCPLCSLKCSPLQESQYSPVGPWPQTGWAASSPRLYAAQQLRWRHFFAKWTWAWICRSIHSGRLLLLLMNDNQYVEKKRTPHFSVSQAVESSGQDAKWVQKSPQATPHTSTRCIPDQSTSSHTNKHFFIRAVGWRTIQTPPLSNRWNSSTSKMKLDVWRVQARLHSSGVCMGRVLGESRSYATSGVGIPKVHSRILSSLCACCINTKPNILWGQVSVQSEAVPSKPWPMALSKQQSFRLAWAILHPT